MSTDSNRPPLTRRGLGDLEELWKALLACGWSSLAVIPTEPAISLQEVVDTLSAATGRSDPPVRCVDARGIDVAEAKRLALDLAAWSLEDSRVVVVVDSLMASLSGAHLVKDVDAVLLVVQVGSMDHDSMRSTLDIVGAERVVGSVTARLGS